MELKIFDKNYTQKRNVALLTTTMLTAMAVPVSATTTVHAEYFSEAHPELQAYYSYLQDDSWIYHYEPDYSEKKMAVFDLNLDGTYEVAFFYAGSSWSNYTAGLLTYSPAMGLQVRKSDAEPDSMGYYITGINENDGIICESRTRGKAVESYHEVDHDGMIYDKGDFATCYLSDYLNNYTENNNWTPELYAEYLSVSSGMTEPVWVDINFDNLNRYLSMDGEKTAGGSAAGTANAAVSGYTAAYENEYIFPDSDKRYLTDNEVMNLAPQILNYAKNEIYARRNRMFNSVELSEYFGSCSWYLPSITPDSFSESVFNDYEIKNVQLLGKYEMSDGRGYVLDQPGYTFDKVEHFLSK